MLLETPVTAAAPRRPAWLLALSPLAFVAWLVAVVATMSGSGVSDSADLTPDQMDGIRVGWALMWPVYAFAVLLGLAGLFLLNRLLSGPLATASQALVAVSGAAILANLVLSEVAAGFGEARLGDNAAYEASLVGRSAARTARRTARRPATHPPARAPPAAANTPPATPTPTTTAARSSSEASPDPLPDNGFFHSQARTDANRPDTPITVDLLFRSK